MAGNPPGGDQALWTELVERLLEYAARRSNNVNAEPLTAEQLLEEYSARGSNNVTAVPLTVEQLRNLEERLRDANLLRPQVTHAYNLRSRETRVAADFQDIPRRRRSGASSSRSVTAGASSSSSLTAAGFPNRVGWLSFPAWFNNSLLPHHSVPASVLNDPSKDLKIKRKEKSKKKKKVNIEDTEWANSTEEEKALPSERRWGSQGLEGFSVEKNVKSVNAFKNELLAEFKLETAKMLEGMIEGLKSVATESPRGRFKMKKRMRSPSAEKDITPLLTEEEKQAAEVLSQIRKISEQEDHVQMLGYPPRYTESEMEQVEKLASEVLVQIQMHMQGSEQEDASNNPPME